jgi:hypothetical protein
MEKDEETELDLEERLLIKKSELLNDILRKQKN